MLTEKLRVGVLRGGPSSEYEVSLQSGARVLDVLRDSPKYRPVDVFIGKDGVWHISGMPHDPHKALKKVDVIFNALHGEYGEDGEVQNLLDTFQIPYTGSRSFASRVAMNKALAKSFLSREGIKTPHYRVLSREENNQDFLREIFRSFPHPLIVKPLSLGSSVGVSIVWSFDDLEDGLRRVFEICERAIIEEFIKGKEATCGVVENFRGEKIYALLPIEIRPPSESAFFDYGAKYGGRSQEICPGNFSFEEKRELERLAKVVHGTLGLRHYSRSDFIVHPRRGIYFLETNTLPGLTSESLLPKALHAVGFPANKFIDHVLALALEGK